MNIENEDKAQNENNKLMYIHKDNDKLLKTFKTICTKIEQ